MEKLTPTALDCLPDGKTSILVDTSSQTMVNLILKWLDEETWLNVNDDCKRFDPSYPRIRVCEGRGSRFGGLSVTLTYSTGSGDDLVMGPEEFVQWVEGAYEVAKESNSFKVNKLTKDYDAQIKENGIWVGCQLVTWEKWRELSVKVAKWERKQGKV
jgi:hypothetical protein